MGDKEGEKVRVLIKVGVIDGCVGEREGVRVLNRGGNRD